MDLQALEQFANQYNSQLANTPTKAVSKDTGIFVKWDMGANPIHILPYDDKQIFFEFKKHLIPNPDNPKSPFYYRCSYSGFGTTCPLCQNSWKINREGNEILSKQLMKKTFVIYNVIYKNQLKVMEVSRPLHLNIWQYITKAIASKVNPFDLKNGMYLEVCKIHKNPGAQDKDHWTNIGYQVVIDAFKKSIISDELITEIQSHKLYHIDDIYPAYTPQELEAVLNGNYDPRGLRKSLASGQQPVLNTATTPSTPPPTAQPAPVLESVKPSRIDVEAAKSLLGM